MLKNISNLGEILNKEDQKSINGGFGFIIAPRCDVPYLVDLGQPCPPGYNDPSEGSTGFCCPNH